MSNDDLTEIINIKTEYTDRALEIVRMIMQRRSQIFKFNNEYVTDNQGFISKVYSMKEFFSSSLNVIAILNTLLGAIIAVFALHIEQIIRFIYGLAFWLIGWAILKFMREGVKIFSNVENKIKAYYVFMPFLRL